MKWNQDCYCCVRPYHQTVADDQNNVPNKESIVNLKMQGFSKPTKHLVEKLKKLSKQEPVI